MKVLYALFFALFLALTPLPGTGAMAGDTDPLFINATTDDPHRAKMALLFAQNQLERKHPVAVFLNDKAVYLGSKAHAAKFGEHQEIIAGLIKNGASIVICPMCMKHFEIKEADLVEGIKVGNPELTGSLLFKDNTKTLTW
jgi:predicted peroxiredoxin